MKSLCKRRDAWDEAICDNSKVLEALAMKLKDLEATWQTGVEESNENLKCKKCEKMFNNKRGLKVNMRFKHRESPHEIISQFDGEVSLILSEGCCDFLLKQMRLKVFLYQKTMWTKNLVSVPYYVDEFENMSDSESATLDFENNSS